MSETVIGSAVEQVTAAVLDALARDEAPTSAALRFLLRSYSLTGRDDVREAIEPALARALELAPAAPLDEQPSWLVLFAEAASMSGDERLPSVAAALTSGVRSTWGSHQPLDVAAAGVEACLRATGVVPFDDLIQSSIDELERIVGATYQPGYGVSEKLSDQIVTASALITAYHVSGRLPYSMLAEELVQAARRTTWNDVPFALNCETATVLSRLASLHRSAEYREAAILAPGADYEEDAVQILRRLAADAPARGMAGAVYGLAATEHQSAL